MNIKTIIAIAALALSVTASAQVAVTTNKGGGSIVLTNKTSTECGEGQRIAYSTSPTNPTIFGCWFADEIMIHIDWKGGSFRSYPINNFSMAGGGE